MKDLVILVPDKNIEFALRGALGRPEALAIRPISHEFRTHMGRDGGARTTGVDVLALEHPRFTHAFLAFLIWKGAVLKPARARTNLKVS